MNDLLISRLSGFQRERLLIMPNTAPILLTNLKKLSPSLLLAKCAQQSPMGLSRMNGHHQVLKPGPVLDFCFERSCIGKSLARIKEMLLVQVVLRIT